MIIEIMTVWEKFVQETDHDTHAIICGDMLIRQSNGEISELSCITVPLDTKEAAQEFLDKYFN